MLVTSIMIFLTEITILIVLGILGNKKKKEGKKWLSKPLYFIILAVIAICTLVLASILGSFFSYEYQDLATAIGAGLTIGVVTAMAKILKRHRKDYDPSMEKEED